MGRWGRSLEFGKHGPEGIGKETDENLMDDTISRDGSEISKILDGIDTSMDDDFEDCEKEPEEEQKEQEEDYTDCKKSNFEEMLKIIFMTIKNFRKIRIK